MKKIHLGLLCLVLVFSFVMCNKDNVEEKNDEVFNPSSNTVKSLGAIETPSSELSALSVAPSMAWSSDIPSEYYISMPPIGYQGNEGSCTAWSCGYGLMSYLFFEKQYFSSTGARDYSKLCSPEFLYNQTKISDCSNGAYISSVLNFLKTNGICTWDVMPYTDTDCSSLPNSSQNSNALKQKIERFERIADLTNANQLKVYLLKGFPIVFGAKVDDGFMSANKDFVWKQKTGTVRGGHAMLICGYDDDKKAFKVFNSWSKSWGDDGYGWIDYSYFANVVYEAYIVYPLKSNNNTTETKIVGVGGDLNFGSVAINGTYTKDLYISNSGNTAFTVTSITCPTGFTGTYAGVIQANTQIKVTISFKPTSILYYSGTITINGNFTSGTNTILVSGSGTSNLTSKSRLNAGEELAIGSYLLSANGVYKLIMQTDGNLVLYKNNTTPVWSTQTNGRTVTKCIMQTDGNLVLYNGSTVVWATMTQGNSGAYLIVQDDANAVIYTPNSVPKWAIWGLGK